MKHNRTALRLRKIPANTVVHIPTKKEARELLAILYENGYKWFGPYSETNLSHYDEYLWRTCYNLRDGNLIDFEERDFYEKEGNVILTLSEFKECYLCDTCTDGCSSTVQVEKPQPKFKVGDKVWLNSLLSKEVGIVKFIDTERGRALVELPGGAYQWAISSIEPYPEPETKSTEDMETKEEKSENPINLCELLQGHTDELFYSPYFGEIEVSIDFCDAFPIIVNGEHLTNDGRLYLTDDCMPSIFPSRALYEQYPLDPYTAWMKWQEKQQFRILRITHTAPDLERNYVEVDFRTPADRDKCIEVIDAFLKQIPKSKSVASLCEELKATIEKYSKK